MNTFTDQIRNNYIKYLVQRQIWCPITQEDILDVRTCVVILDGNGDPETVYSPAGWKFLVDLMDGDETKVLASPYTKMER